MPIFPLFYVGIIFLITICLIAVQHERVTRNYGYVQFFNNYSFYLTLFLLITITTLRSTSFGDDTLSYLRIFNNAENIVLSTHISGEALFYGLIKLFKYIDSYGFFIFIYTIASAILVRLSVKNISIFSYSLFFPYLFTNRLFLEGITNGIRSTLAIFIIFLGLTSLYKSRRYLIFAVLVALFIHFKITIILA